GHAVLPGRELPETARAVGAAGGDQVRARAEGERRHPRGLAQIEARITGEGVDDDDPLRAVADGEQRASWTDRREPDGARHPHVSDDLARLEVVHLEVGAGPDRDQLPQLPLGASQLEASARAEEQIVAAGAQEPPERGQAADAVELVVERGQAAL